MGSLAGRVSATAGAFFKEHPKQVAIGVNQKSKNYHSPGLSLLKPTLATPLLTWTLQTQISFRHLIAASLQSPRTCLWRIGLPDEDLGGDLGGLVGGAEQSCNRLHSFRFRRRRSFQDPGIFLIAARGDGACDDATVIVEETAAIEDSKVRKASVAARNLIFTWRILSLITTLALCVLHWLDGIFTKGQEYMKPRFERLKMRSEPLRYWTFIFCLLFCWLSIAFFLHWQVQRWELRTMVLGELRGVTDGALDTGGSFCQSLWPNTGLGCQLSYTTI